MTSSMSPRRGAALIAFALAAGCLGTPAPVPEVRWFDPLPPIAAASLAGEPAAVRVVAAPHLGREFVVRIGPHEVALDSQHQWIAEPRELVATVLARALAGAVTPPAVATATLDTFELDVTASPRAHIRIAFGKDRPAGTPATVDEWAPAADRSPAAFAAAMAKALAQLEARVRH